jgi:hypothetical protein
MLFAGLRSHLLLQCKIELVHSFKLKILYTSQYNDLSLVMTGHVTIVV